jgi:hypothetical protein
MLFFKWRYSTTSFFHHEKSRVSLFLIVNFISSLSNQWRYYHQQEKKPMMFHYANYDWLGLRTKIFMIAWIRRRNSSTSLMDMILFSMIEMTRFVDDIEFWAKKGDRFVLQLYSVDLNVVKPLMGKNATHTLTTFYFSIDDLSVQKNSCSSALYLLLLVVL